MSNIENLYHLNLLRKINNLSKKYYESIDGRTTYEHDSYLAECNAALFDYFKKSLNERFLFSASSYITHTKYKAKITLVKGDDADTDYNFNDESVIKGFSEFKNELNEALQKVIHEKGLVSMTNILLDKKNTHDLYLVGSDKVYTTIPENESNLPANIIELPLGKIKYIENPVHFREDEENKILIKELFDQLVIRSNYASYFDIMVSDYIWHYKKISNTYYKYNRKHFFIYFIRPSIIDDKYGYNLLLSLATNEKLTETELTIIDLLVYKIVSQMFIEKVKDEEHQNLLTLRSGIGHFLKNRVDTNLVFKIQKENTLNNVIIQKSCKKLQEQFKSLFNIGSLFHIISAITKNNANSVLGTDLSIKKSWVQSEALKLSEIFTQLSHVEYKNMKSTESKIEIIAKSPFNIDQLVIRPFLNNDALLPVSWIYKEIFFELFFNACKYSKSETIVYNIAVEFDETSQMLILSNTLKDESIHTNAMFSECIGRWGKIQSSSLTELTGLAFVEEFLKITKIGELYSKVLVNDLYFSIGLKLKGLKKTA